jgi:hypothetical protein
MDDEFVLDETNFEIYAMKAYSAPCLSVVEFYDDLKKVKYIKRLLNRYKNGGELKDRLILNHIILLSNVFSVEHATRILFYKIDCDLWPELKAFLVHLNYMPKRLVYIKKYVILADDIETNEEILTFLKRYE